MEKNKAKRVAASDQEKADCAALTLLFANEHIILHLSLFVVLPLPYLCKHGPLTPPPSQTGVLGPRGGRIPAAGGKFWAKIRILERIASGASGFRRKIF